MKNYIKSYKKEIRKGAKKGRKKREGPRFHVCKGAPNKIHVRNQRAFILQKRSDYLYPSLFIFFANYLTVLSSF